MIALWPERTCVNLVRVPGHFQSLYDIISVSWTVRICNIYPKDSHKWLPGHQLCYVFRTLRILIKEMLMKIEREYLII